MRCSEFEHHLQSRTEIASQDSLAHAGECGACGARLQEEELLSRSFAEIAAHVAQISPAAEIQARVLTRFERDRLIHQRRSPGWSIYAGVAIAAGLLLLAGVSFALLRRQPNQTSPGHNSPFDFSAAVAAVELSEKAPQFETPAKPRQSKRHSVTNSISHAATTSEAPPEIATDFIRINYAAPIEPGAQIVRVQLPRSAMMQFGLPVNMDRADQPVKADVIMGIDGTAQAIRFVQ